MRVRLLLFAVLRDIVGTGERELSLPDGTTAGDVWAGLRAEHPQLARYAVAPLMAINASYADASTELRESDELAFIPPVAGG